MPQRPSLASPVITNKALGINDFRSEVKLPKGAFTFECNMVAQGDVRNRRKGRDFEFLDSNGGLVLGFYQLVWDDGLTAIISAIGSNLMDLGVSFSYLMANGTKLYIQSPDGNYWDCTPDSNGLINPVVANTPSATAQAANFTVLNGESFGFTLSSGNVTRLLCDQDHNGWWLQGYGATTASSTISTDMVFTQASGFSFRIQDYSSNTWKFRVTNAGNLEVITV